MKPLDPFYPIVDSCGWLRRLLPLGIKLVQLRVKDRHDAELRAEISAALDLCAAHSCQLIVNDYWQLAMSSAATLFIWARKIWTRPISIS